ncbi:MAG: NUDIX domain-containing protein [Candidatus Nomurabacteria bacterium]|nr:MAG: NUDIX domain-containing protein [Candidatus Nomurabacteria bacterium]
MQNHAPREADSPEEVLDLVDENDSVIDSISRKEVYRRGLKNFRVVHAFIINSEGKIWTPRRVSTKKLFPNGLDYSIAGHVSSGGTYEEALIKEAEEEVNLQLTPENFVEIAHLKPHLDHTACFQKLFEIKTNKTPSYNPEEFSGFEWLTPEEIVKRGDEGEIMKSDLSDIVRRFYL